MRNLRKKEITRIKEENISKEKVRKEVSEEKVKQKSF